MATATQAPTQTEPVTALAVAPVYDRSSLVGDFMVTVPGQTSEDFEEFAPESRICEYFNGTIYLPSPATDRHQELVWFLQYIIGTFLYARGGGKMLAGPAVLRLSEDWKPEPDIFVKPPPGPNQPPALLVVEVLSKSTREHDLGLKRSTLWAAGILELWFVDDRDGRVIVDRLGANGELSTEELSAGRLRSSALPGLWIDVSWLWETELPNGKDCVDAILGPPPG